MQCGILDRNLGGKQNMSAKTSEILINFIIYLKFLYKVNFLVLISVLNSCKILMLREVG